MYVHGNSVGLTLWNRFVLGLYSRTTNTPMDGSIVRTDCEFVAYGLSCMVTLLQFITVISIVISLLRPALLICIIRSVHWAQCLNSPYKYIGMAFVYIGLLGLMRMRTICDWF